MGIGNERSKAEARRRWPTGPKRKSGSVTATPSSISENGIQVGGQRGVGVGGDLALAPCSPQPRPQAESRRAVAIHPRHARRRIVRAE